ncbi:MAG: YbbR-like domain-containing protein [Bacteroidales bacterium]|nr:YbbR-like domain-containing protein [Bacteroidales bacterium]
MSPGENSGNHLKRIQSKLRDKLLKRNVAVFSFFLLLSFIFWFINALSKNINGTLTFPVRYVNFPENMALINELPDVFTLNVEGPGYSVLKTRISGHKAPLVIDVNNSDLLVKDNETGMESYIYSYKLSESFNRQIRADFYINTISPDSIRFLFDKLIRKNVPVKPDVKVNTQRQFMLNGDIVIKPDSVEISGPKALIDTISFVKTEYHEFNHVKDMTSRNLNLESIRKVAVSHKRAEITLPVEQFTEEIMDIKLRILNKPDTANVRLFPDMVSIYFNIPLSNYNRIQDMPLEAVVDMENLDVRTVDRLKVEVINIPSYISNVRHNPRQVEYIIEKK